MKKIILIAAGILSMQFAFAQWGQRTPTPNDTLKSVRVNPDGSVTFSIYAPNANSVSLSGDVWGPGPFQKAENGVWSATIQNMNPGAVRYAFNVDGLQVFDPKYSRLGEIRPVAKIDKGEDQFWSQKDVPHGAVSVIYYKSSTTGTTRRMHVWTPAGYTAKGKKLPVFYLIHGGGDNDASWPGVGCAGDILDNLLAEGKMKPMIVVMPDGSMDTEKFTEDLDKDIMPYMAKNFRIKKGAKNTALAGLSMGGLETLNCFMAYPEKFGYIDVMSSGWFKGNDEMYSKGSARLKEIASTLNKKCKILLFTMGGQEDIAYENCKEMLKCFDEAGIPYEYSEMPGGHSWHVWRHDLYHFAPRLFK